MKITDIATLSDKCTACTACLSSCPTNAIEMEMNSEGFLFPIIHQDRCIDCGKCYQVCQINNSYPINNPLDIVAGYAIDEEERKNGSSGGIVGLLSKYIKSQDGVVYGAVFDSLKKKVIHSSSDNYTLEELSKSKYVQSNLGNVFQEIYLNISLGRYVLFCGTPCQVIGLKEYLGNDYPNLITIDFFCHGVPSPGYFNKILLDLEKKNESEILNVSFREKSHGWRNLYIKFYFKNSNVLEKKSSEFHYYYYFLKNYILRKSCYGCDKFNRHLSDLTVADFWQVSKELDDDKGISLIMKNTTKGKEAVKLIENNMVEHELCDEKVFDESIYSHGYSMLNRNKFFKMYQKYGYEYMKNIFFRKEKIKNDKKIRTLRKYNHIKHLVKKTF